MTTWRIENGDEVVWLDAYTMTILRTGPDRFFVDDVLVSREEFYTRTKLPNTEPEQPTDESGSVSELNIEDLENAAKAFEHDRY